MFSVSHNDAEGAIIVKAPAKGIIWESQINRVERGSSSSPDIDQRSIH
jgi:hypothetical protein